jgi:hypothetical protein
MRRVLSAVVVSFAVAASLGVACSSNGGAAAGCADRGCADGNMAPEGTEDVFDAGAGMEATVDVVDSGIDSGLADSGIALEAGEGSTPVVSGCPYYHPPRSGQTCTAEGLSCTGQDYGYGWCPPACTCTGGTWSCVPSTCSCPADSLPYFFMTEPCYQAGQQCDYQAGCTSCTCRGYGGDAGPFGWSCTSTCRDAGEPLWCLTEAGYCPG